MMVKRCADRCNALPLALMFGVSRLAAVSRLFVYLS